VSAQPKPFGAETLENLRREFEAGDKFRLIAAIAFCARHQLVMPEWVASAFLPGANQWLRHEVKALGDALDVAWSKGMQQPAARQKKELMWSVFNKIEELRCTPANRYGNPLDDGLFEKVGVEFGIKKTVTKEYYSEAKRWLEGDFSQS